MKKRIIMSLSLMLLLFNAAKPVQAEDSKEMINLKFNVLFENVDWQVYAQENTDIGGSIVYHENGEYRDDVYNFNLKNQSYDLEYEKPGENINHYRHFLNSSQFNNKYYEVDYDIPLAPSPLYDSAVINYGLKLKRTELFFNLSIHDFLDEPISRTHCKIEDWPDDGEDEAAEDGYEDEEPIEDETFFVATRLQEEDIDFSGSKFELYDLNGTLAYTFETDNDGLAYLDDVVYGKYIIKQISAPEGVKVYDEPFEIDLDLKEDSDS